MPLGIDNLVSQVQSKMAELPFVAESYGRAYLVADATKGSRIPGIHISGAKYDYKDMLPRDNVNSFSFIYIPGRYTFPRYDTNDYSTIADIDFDIIFFGDLRQLTPDPHNISTSYFVEQTIKKLSGLGGVKIMQVDEQNREVYNQFSADIETKYFMWPFCLFRLKLSWNFEIPCP